MHEETFDFIVAGAGSAGCAVAARLSESLDAVHAAGRTVVLTTHDLARSAAAATHYLVVVEGRARSKGRLPAGDLASIYERAVAAEEG